MSAKISSTIDRYSKDMQQYEGKVFGYADKILHQYQTGCVSPDNKKRLDEVIEIVNKLKQFKFDHAQKVNDLKKAEKQQEDLEIRQFIEYHNLVSVKFLEGFAKITEIQQKVQESKHEQDLNQLREEINEIRTTQYVMEAKQETGVFGTITGKLMIGDAEGAATEMLTYAVKKVAADSENSGLMAYHAK